MQTTQPAAPSWFDVINQFGIGIADRAQETLQYVMQDKLDKELGRSNAPATETQANLDASANLNVQEANAPEKGRDADGATLTDEKIEFAGVSASRSTLKKAGIALAVMTVGFLGYKAVMS